MTEEIVGIIVEGAAQGLAQGVLDISIAATSEAAAQTQCTKEQQQAARDWVKAIWICILLLVTTISAILLHSKRSNKGIEPREDSQWQVDSALQ